MPLSTGTSQLANTLATEICNCSASSVFTVEDKVSAEAADPPTLAEDAADPPTIEADVGAHETGANVKDAEAWASRTKSLRFL